jgi:hypothetical protein
MLLLMLLLQVSSVCSVWCTLPHHPVFQPAQHVYCAHVVRVEHVASDERLKNKPVTASRFTKLEEATFSKLLLDIAADEFAQNMAVFT